MQLQIPASRHHQSALFTWLHPRCTQPTAQQHQSCHQLPHQIDGAGFLQQPLKRQRHGSAWRGCSVQAYSAPTIADIISRAQKPEKVADVMNKRSVFTCKPDTTIDEALNILVENKITGMPVVDEAGKVVGVVSDYDMLTLDNISGRMEQTGIFPTASMDWEAFHEVQKLILKNVGKIVGDVMTPDPLVVRPETNIEAAARILLQRKVRRLPVVNDSGKLVGMFSRSDVIKAAMETRRALHARVQAGK